MPLPKWVPLSEALQLVMRTSVSEKQAKRDICNALADGKIRLRLCFMWRPKIQDFLTGRDKPTTEVRYVKKSQIPAILKPGDFNWPRSQVRKPELWLIRGPGGSFFGFWRVLERVRYAAADPSPHSQRGGRSRAYQHRVELHSADVLKVLCNGEKVPDEQAAVRRSQPKGEPKGAKTRGIIEAIRQLWPNHRIPEGLTAKDRDKAIIDQLTGNGGSVPSSRTIKRSVPSSRTIQRVLKKLKSK
jgi:hypothetical protein